MSAWTFSHLFVAGSFIYNPLRKKLFSLSKQDKVRFIWL